MTSRIAVWTGVLFVIGVFLIILSRAGVTSPVENAALVVTSPAQDAFSGWARPVSDFFGDVTDSGDLRDENQRLRDENDRLASEVARLRENEIRLQDLQDLLQVRETRPDEEFVVASIFAREPSSLRDVFAIDRGKRDGVHEGMVVLTEGGSLVGTVTTVLDDYAWVTQISDASSTVSAMTQETRAQGVVEGSYGRGLRMDFVRQGAEVKAGDVIITSGIGGNFPPGLLIGFVTTVDSTPQEIFQAVSIDPVASLPDLETVLVLTSFTPREVRAP